jgi:hypothetical protein
MMAQCLDEPKVQAAILMDLWVSLNARISLVSKQALVSLLFQTDSDEWAHEGSDQDFLVALRVRVLAELQERKAHEEREVIYGK